MKIYESFESFMCKPFTIRQNPKNPQTPQYPKNPKPQNPYPRKHLTPPPSPCQVSLFSTAEIVVASLTPSPPAAEAIAMSPGAGARLARQVTLAQRLPVFSSLPLDAFGECDYIEVWLELRGSVPLKGGQAGMGWDGRGLFFFVSNKRRNIKM